MYLYLGGEAAVDSEELVGIFDLDKTSSGKITREYLTQAEKSGLIENAAEDIPKSFAVLTDDKIILAQPNPSVLARRWEKR